MKYRKAIYYIAGLSVLISVSLLGYFFVSTKKIPQNTPVTTTIKTEKGEDIVVELVKIDDSEMANTKNVVATPVPDLDRLIQVPVSTPPAQKEKITNQIKAIIAILRQDASLFNEWIDLGLLRKSIEDYEGAREAWEYASALRPKNSLSFGNLAMLYGYYLQNPVLAEKNYLKSIENDPQLPYLYIQGADFYTEVLNKPEKAREILEKGLQMIPGDDGLESALENL